MISQLVTMTSARVGLVIIVMNMIWAARSELYSSIPGLERLLDTETRSVNLLNAYIRSEEQRLKKLKNLVHTNKEGGLALVPPELSHASARYSSNGGMVDYSNPIEAYLAMKRIVLDQSSILGILRMNKHKEYLSQLRGVLRPADEDLDGAAIALMRLQDAYLLDTQQMVNGFLPNIPKHQPMTSDDVFRVAFVAFQRKDWYHAIIWLNATMASLQNEKTLKKPVRRSFTINTVFDYLAYSLFSQGNVEHALWYTKILKTVDPNHPAIQNIAYYEHIINNGTGDGQPVWDGTFGALPALKNKRIYGVGYPMYERLCRGETTMTEHEKKYLTCYYKDDLAFLKLAKIKVERMYLDPEVLLFRDVVSDTEIEQLKDIARPQLQRALVVNDKPDEWGASENVAANYRIAQNMWLEDIDDPLVMRISRRIEDMTGLSMQSAEGLQVASYGMGGHYEPHYDMDTDFHTSINDTVKRNRIATILFYLTETLAGGSTIFEDLGIAVAPDKGCALFWHNLHRNSNPDLRTKHAGCPVLYGYKWVANKWPHEAGQEFRRKCSLDENE